MLSLSALGAGCDDFLPKPMQAQALFDALGRHLGRLWIRSGGPGLDAATVLLSHTEIAALARPPAEALARLMDPAQRGRVRAHLDELQRLEEGDPELRPWIGQMRGLTKSFKLRALCELFRG